LIAIAPATVPGITSATLDGRALVLTMRLSLPGTRYNELQRAAFADRLTARCTALPGVLSASAVSQLGANLRRPGIRDP